MSIKSSKIVDLLEHNDEVVSIEVTPEVTSEELEAARNPVFISVTWHAKSYPNPDLAIPPIRLATLLREEEREVLLHLSCDQLKKDFLDSLLKYLQEKDICNLFVVLGDGFEPSQSDFQSTVELIVYIRNKAGDYFCIGVAGYPDDFSKMAALKDKVKSGANFIITQAFFECHIFQNFLQVCLNWEIKVPIIPGIFLFETNQQLIRFADICKVKFSKSFSDLVHSSNESEFSGSQIMENIMTAIISGALWPSRNMHIFTMNKVKNVYRIMDLWIKK